MRLFFDLFTAWISVVLLVAVTVIWILRILVKKQVIKKNSVLFNLNRNLRIHHKSLGIAFLVIAVIHAILSSQELFSFNWGSMCILGIAIMSLSYIFKSKVERKYWLYTHRWLTITVVVLLIVHLFDVGISTPTLIKNALSSNESEYHLDQEEIDDIVEDVEDELNEAGATNTIEESGTSQSETTTEITAEPTTEATTEPTAEPTGPVYQAGTYTGVADGFGPNLTVEVTIENNIITDIVVVSHNERNESFWGTPVEVIPQLIIESQSVEVDSVSGATYTSIGIKNAVLDALTQALVSGELPEEQQASSRGRGH